MPIVVLDRDGVINHDSDDYIKTPDEWVPIEGSLEAIALLCDAGYSVVVASNQSGLGRKLFTDIDLANIHHKLCYMAEEAGAFIDGIFYCPHLPDEGCACRKPATGLLSEIESQLSCKLGDAFFVGDSNKDIEAARSFGLRPILVRTGKGLETESYLTEEMRAGLPVSDNLMDAVCTHILNSHE